jgi:hypothetical protein
MNGKFRYWSASVSEINKNCCCTCYTFPHFLGPAGTVATFNSALTSLCTESEPVHLKEKCCNLYRDRGRVSVSYFVIWYLFCPLKPTGHYMYRPLVTICSGHWSLYVPPSGHCMYRKLLTICIAQWSLYVPHTGHYMYRPVVTICTVQWLLYVPHSGHYMYRPLDRKCVV